MANFFEVFGKKHVFLAVIHVLDYGQVMDNIRIARTNGADGVFLINHNGSVQRLFQLYVQAKIRHPKWWIGVNPLGLDVEQAVRVVPDDTSGLWVDNAGIKEDAAEPAASAWQVYEKLKKLKPSILYFGGVAFKGQAEVNDLSAVTKLAVGCMDVITTSGPGTGFAPSVKKLAEMQQAASGHPIAVASGMDSTNVKSFMPYTNCFIVATGISRSFYHFDAQKVSMFADQLGKQ